MSRYEYDEEASAAWQMDVVHEVDDSPATVSRWVDAMRRLNTINDPLARKLVALHRDCGSGTGVCDSLDSEPDPMDRRSNWGCETTELIADHFSVEYPRGLPSDYMELKTSTPTRRLDAGRPEQSR